MISTGGVGTDDSSNHMFSYMNLDSSDPLQWNDPWGQTYEPAEHSAASASTPQASQTASVAGTANQPPSRRTSVSGTTYTDPFLNRTPNPFYPGMSLTGSELGHMPSQPPIVHGGRTLPQWLSRPDLFMGPAPETRGLTQPPVQPGFLNNRSIPMHEPFTGAPPVTPVSYTHLTLPTKRIV